MKDKLIESFSGIRGVYGESLIDEIAQKYAYVYATSLPKDSRVVIASDGRDSGNKLMSIFRDTFLKFGFQVIDLGNTGTPQIELAIRHFKAQGGVIITASHNEPKFNGWKLLGPDSAVLKVDEIKRIIDLTKENIDYNYPNKEGELIKEDITDIYIDDVLNILKEDNINQIKERKFRILADPNGSPVSQIIIKLFKQLNIEFVGIGMEEGIRNRKIEPNHETLKYLIPKLEENNLDFGFGLDGDADRMELVLKNKEVTGNEMLAMGIESVLSQGGNIVTNNATSHLISEIANRYDAKVHEVDVGETNVVTKMEELNSPVGGEGSNGGLIVSPTKCRDGILSIAIILSLLANKEETIEEVLSNYPTYYEKRIKAQSNDPDIRDKLLKYYKDWNIRTYRGDVSGIKVMYNEKSWLFYRGSQTEPGLFRIIANSNDKELTDKMISDGEKVFNQL